MELLDYVKYFGVLAILILGIYVVVMLLKKIMQPKASVSAQHNDIFNSKSASLFIQEVLPVDQKTKIIILARDNKRHVILLGENHSHLIESVSPEALQNNQPDFNAATQVGSITLGTNSADQFIPEDNKPEPDVSNISSEPAPSEPALTTNIKSSPPAKTPKPAKKSATPSKSQVEDDLGSDDGLKIIKSKLQDAKKLADPAKD